MTLKSIIGSLVGISILLTSSLANDRNSSISSLTPSANMAITSNYIWRGASLSNDTLVFQSGFDLEHSSGLHVGTWASEITDGTEIDLYLGYATKMFPPMLDKGINIDIGFIDYGTITPSTQNIDFSNNAEIYIALSSSISKIDLAMRRSYDVLAQVVNMEVSLGYDASIVNVSLATGYNESLYSQLHIGIPSSITTGEFGIDAGYTSSNVVVGISHSISF